VSDESGYPDDWQDDPMTTKTVKENVADRNRSNYRRIKPKKHMDVISSLPRSKRLFRARGYRFPPFELLEALFLANIFQY
jgi:hypothetical protein